MEPVKRWDILGKRRAYRKVTVAQIAENLHADYDRVVSEHTAHHILQHMGLCMDRQVRVPKLKSVYH